MLIQMDMLMDMSSSTIWTCINCSLFEYATHGLSVDVWTNSNWYLTESTKKGYKL